jgi:hypothetical protein
MFGNHVCINPLSARKQLLLAESELNRARLSRDVHRLTTGVRGLTARTQTTSLVATSAIGLVSGLAALRRERPAKPGRVQMAVKAAGLIASLWLSWRAQSGRR